MKVDEGAIYLDLNYLNRSRTDKNSSDIEEMKEVIYTNEVAVFNNTSDIERVEKMFSKEMLDSLYERRIQREVASELIEEIERLERNMKGLIAGVSVGFFVTMILIVSLFI